MNVVSAARFSLSILSLFCYWILVLYLDIKHQLRWSANSGTKPSLLTFCVDLYNLEAQDASLASFLRFRLITHIKFMAVCTWVSRSFLTRSGKAFRLYPSPLSEQLHPLWASGLLEGPQLHSLFVSTVLADIFALSNQRLVSAYSTILVKSGGSKFFQHALWHNCVRRNGEQWLDNRPLKWGYLSISGTSTHRWLQ